MPEIRQRRNVIVKRPQTYVLSYVCHCEKLHSIQVYIEHILCQKTTIEFKQKQLYCWDQTLPLILHGTSYRSRVNYPLSDESTIFHIFISEFVIRRSILNLPTKFKIRETSLADADMLAFANSRHTIQAQSLQQNIVSIQSPDFLLILLLASMLSAFAPAILSQSAQTAYHTTDYSGLGVKPTNTINTENKICNFRILRK